MLWKDKKNQWEDRRVKIIALRDQGYSWNEVGKKFGITGVRVMQIYKKYAKKSTIPKKE